MSGRTALGDLGPGIGAMTALAVLLALLVSPSAATAEGNRWSGAALQTAAIDSGQTPQALANALVGAGVTVSNVSFTGDGRAAGTFSGGEGVIGIPGGIVLSSGVIADVVGPNSSGGTGTGLSQPGDADLDAAIGANTQDAAVLEFDFVPDGTQVFFEYVFGSEEYNEFVDQGFNDVFAFFVNGTNCATVGGAPVSVNSINLATNASLYVNNDLGSGAIRNTELDGLTRVLACQSAVNQGVTNRLKLAIADNGDSIFDSAVFLRGASLTADAGSITGTITGGSVPLPAAPVQVCPDGSTTAGDCLTTFADANGQYLLAPVPPGAWTVTAFPPAGSDLHPRSREGVAISAGQTAVVELDLAPFDLAPSGTRIEPFVQLGPIPLIPWNMPTTITHDDCAGGTATYAIVQNGVTLASGSLSETSTGTYTGTVASLQPAHGYATLTITVVCPGGTTSITPVTIYIDPSGTVQDTNGTPIAGATVTLTRADTAAGPFEMVPQGSAIMSPANRTNPVTTPATGVFRWDTIAGFYVVRATAPGCSAPGDATRDFVETAVLPVPPPQLDLDLVLFCGETTSGGGTQPSVAPGSGGTGALHPEPTIADGVTRIDAGGNDDPATIALQTCDLLTEQSAASRADSVVIATSVDFPDTLAGAPLAGANSCVLFASGTGFAGDAAVRDQARRVLAPGGDVVILGGTNAVAQGIEDQLRADGFAVRRLGGATRFETAEAIAAEVIRRNPGAQQVILAYGLNWPDAVTVGAYAAALELPIVLTDTATLHPAARRVLDALPAAEVLVIGGRFVISDAVLAEVGGRRIAGDNRMATAVAVAEQLWPAVPSTGSDFVVVNLEADENAWQLALQAAPLAARIRGPQLGVRATQYPAETAAYLASLGFTELPRVVLLGNLGLISGEVAAAIDDDIQPG